MKIIKDSRYEDAGKCFPASSGYKEFSEFLKNVF